MRLYLDTEFTDLKPGAKLISIALVDEDENVFYAELTDTWTYEDCSPFVHNHVLNKLNGPKFQMTYIQCQQALGDWIESRGQSCIIASDNPSWELPFLNALIDICPPANLMRGMIYPVQLTDNTVSHIILKHGYTIHHAAHDALIMKKGICNRDEYL